MMMETGSKENSIITCKYCGRRTARGIFCERCGKEVTDAPEAVSEPMAKEPQAPASEPAEPADPAIELPESSRYVSAEALEISKPSMAEKDSAPSAPVPPPAPAAYNTSTACKYLAVEYDRRQIFVENMPAILRFRLMPLVSGLKDMRIWVECQAFNGASVVREKRLHWLSPEMNRKREFRFPIELPNYGAHCCVLHFGFSIGNDRFVFDADEEMVVYPRESDAAEVLRNLTVNINNDIKTGHAADVNVKHSVNEIEGLTRMLRPNASIIEVLDRLKNGMAAYCMLEIYGSTWTPDEHRSGSSSAIPKPPAGSPPRKAVIDRLTLVVGDQQLQLVSGDEIPLGRSRDNTIITRIFDAKGKMPRNSNLEISGRHCRLTRRHGALFLDDGSPTKCSQQGTYLDGNPVDYGRSVAIDPNPLSLMLSLAAIEEHRKDVFALHLTPWRCEPRMRRHCREALCSGDRDVAALIMRRRDNAPECYLALWACCPLKLIFPELEDLTLWRKENAFAWGNASKNGWLIPGMEVKAGNRTIGVTQWQQYGLKPK